MHRFVTGLLIVLLAVTVPQLAHATRFTERFVTIDPLTESFGGDRAVTPLGTYGVWAEYGAYTAQRDDEHAFNIKLGGFFELFRVRDVWSVSWMSNIELVANDQNDLLFSPRATFWEEGFFFARRWGRRSWQLGYYHRCKHDVDNLHGKQCDGGGCERSIIHGSVQGKLLLPIEPGRGVRSRLVARGDLYTILQDDRFPTSTETETPNMEQGIASLGADYHLQAPTRTEWLGLWATGYTTMFLYGPDRGSARFDGIDSVRWNGGVSGGVAFRGRARLRFGLSYEYLHDTSINPSPESAHLVMITLQVIAAESMW